MTPDNDDSGEDQNPPKTQPPDLSDIKGQNSIQYSVDIPK
jgi:hypothetical protein